MRNRAGAGVRSQLKAERRYVRGRMKWRLAAIVLLFAATAVGMNVWAPLPTWWGGFVAGIFVMAIPLLLLHLDVVFGIATRAMGHEAEQWTAEAMRMLWPWGWRLVNDVRFARLNVDHVAIGPSRILVLETKWLGAERDLSRALPEAALQAAHAARKIRNLLRTPPALVRQVEPVALLWGPGVPRKGLPVAEIDGVALVSDANKKSWLRELRAERGRPDREALAALTHHQRRSKVPPPKPRIGAPRD